jgi:CubicO group peptidase (beta-lactamase class C family)
MKRIILSALSLLLLIGLATGATLRLPEVNLLEQRLDRLVEELEIQRQTLHVPGMAIAIVKDDDIILAHGFGVSNLETETPVTPETIFAIGSSTKAFTSTLVGMLVDEGKIYWDDPVTDYLPYFEMNIKSNNEEAEITIADLLSHRTGFVRMGILFASGKIPREEILHDATAAEPWAEFREQFYYSNVMYMAAGVAAEEITGTDWETLIHERIFEPLGMESSTTSIIEAQEDPRLSLGYLWDEDLQEYRYKQMINVDNIGPAGSINSNVIDMAQWVRLQLGTGEYQRQRMISEEQLLETWKSHIEIAEGVSYGLGWMIREWQGQTVIEHGGNVDGFTAQVALLPESDLGFVLLTNASVSPLPAQVINMVWEAILGEWEEDKESEPDEYEPYLGEYIANFGTWQNEEFTVLVQNSRLVVDIPGQQTYELKDPDEEGNWYFAISDDIAISFDRDDNNDIVIMKLHQSGMIFELPRKGFEIEPEIPLTELQKYLGSYHSEEMGVTVKALIQNNRLAIDWPGQMVYELNPPNESGIWTFRVSGTIGVKFNETDDGTIDSLSVYQSGMRLNMLKIEDETLPTIDEIMALRKTDLRTSVIQNIGAYEISGTAYFPQSGAKAIFTTYISGDDRFSSDYDYGKYGYSRTLMNNGRVQIVSSFRPVQELHGKLLEQTLLSHPSSDMGDWRNYYDSIEVLRSDILDGIKVYLLKMKSGNLPSQTVYVDASTGDVLKSEVFVLQEGGIEIPVTTRNEDFRDFYGIRIPFRSISSNEMSGSSIVQIDNIEKNLDIPDAIFTLVQPE